MAGTGTLSNVVPVMPITTAASPQLKGDDADFGDFVSTEEEQIDLEDVAEHWAKYDLRETSQVFYPICLGEVLGERYLVEHKIARFRPDAEEIEREHVRSIMSRVFIYCPEERLTATQLLQDPLFRAIMSKYGC